MHLVGRRKGLRGLAEQENRAKLPPAVRGRVDLRGTRVRFDPLDEEARFLDIPEVIAGVLERHAGDPAANLGDLVEADRKARETAGRILAYQVRT